MLDLMRRELVLKDSVASSAYAMLRASRAGAFPSRPSETVIPRLDQPAENRVPQVIQDQRAWENFDSWITPSEESFSIAHPARPAVDPAMWTLEIDGLADSLLSLTLDDIRPAARGDLYHRVLG